MTQRVIFNDLEAAQFLLTATDICVDIETDTTPPEDDDPESWGLTYNSDMTHVSFYDGVHQPVVFDQPYQTDRARFIEQVLSRDNIRIIGHNVTFDLTHLGGHLKFKVARHSRVWDTMVIAVRTMMAEAERKNGNKELALSYQAEKWQTGPVFQSDDMKFYGWMKGLRGKLSDLAGYIPALLLEESLRWALFLNPNNTEEGGEWGPGGVGHLVEDFLERFVDINDYNIKQKLNTTSYRDALNHWQPYANNVISHYVAMDTVTTYRLFKRQFDFIVAVHQGPTRMGDRVVPKWEELPELIKREQRISRVGANQSIVGLKLDIPYVQKQIKVYEQQFVDNLAQMNVAEADDDFNRLVGMGIWFERIMKVVTEEKATYSDPKRWAHWSYQNVTDSQVFQMFADRSDVTAEDMEIQGEWSAWLAGLNVDLKRKAILETSPAVAPPQFDLVGYIERHRYAGSEYSRYLAQLHYEWLEHYFTEPKPIPAERVVNKNLWKPYYLFCRCGIPLPDSETIKFNPDLVTKKHATWVTLESVRVGEGNESELDYRQIAIDSHTFSVGTKAVDHYLPSAWLDEDEKEPNPAFETHPARYYREAINAETALGRCTEFIQHAAKDGYIHSNIPRSSRTGRGRSSNPNMQNNDMAKVRGYFIAEPGYWLVEADYSNAENVMGALISGDNNFAYATESGDFHMAQTRLFWGAEVDRLIAAGLKDELKELRRMSKRITFGESYGMGVDKMVIATGMTRDQVADIVQAKRRAYAVMYARKKEAGEAAARRVREGYFPAYTTLWNKQRVIVPSYNDGTLADYKAWNYLQQGGVAEMVAGAKLEATEWLEDNGYQTCIPLDVHDSLVICVRIGEEDIVLPKILDIMAEQVPLAFRNRTVPATHFIAEIGPENAQKWGYREDGTYPFSLEHFWNRWGKFKLPDEELAKAPAKREALTWRGPVHEGWTLEKEMAAQQLDRLGDAVPGQHNLIAQPVNVQKWSSIINLTNRLRSGVGTFERVAGQLEQATGPRSITYTKDDKPVTIGPFNFVEYLTARDALLARGHIIQNDDFSVVSTGILKVYETLNELSKHIVAINETGLLNELHAAASADT